MAILATITEVEDSLGRSLSSEEQRRAMALLELASAEVLDMTGFRFLPGTYTVGRKVRSGKVTLPATVATITAVRAIDQVDGTVDVLTPGLDYTTHRRTVYGLDEAQFVEVDFTVTASVSPMVSGVVAGIVATTISGPPVGTASESAGPFQVSYVNSSGKVWLSASDKSILRRYTQPRPAMDLL